MRVGREVTAQEVTEDVSEKLTRECGRNRVQDEQRWDRKDIDRRVAQFRRGLTPANVAHVTCQRAGGVCARALVLLAAVLANRVYDTPS